MKLSADTRGQSDARGKPRVWLTCHPEDVDTALPKVREDLLRHANCAVWHDAEMTASYDLRELEACLNEMQLVVLAVTSKFLYTDHRAKDVELKYALRQHIPVLPILLESGLSREFNRLTDTKIQVVNRCVNDPTATPYDEVLGTYLKSVLVGDELAEKVRDAFDAYVFLSYRKKDRRHAQRLMHLIHENRQFRDIAIWYDEFLVPGEKYNDAIQQAFRKSGLFALAVTPNLLEPDNYVMKVEYPLAHDRKKDDGDLEIVPVELYETELGDPRIDKTKLKAAYKDIPPVQDEHRTSEMNAALLDALERIAKKENDGSARHRFFIGLAYLCGIDVEINQARALELIQSAAEDPEPCYDATEKLVDMYKNGDGVARNLDTAIDWQRKLCAQYRVAYEAQHDPDAHMGYGTKFLRATIALSDMLREAGDLDGAYAAANHALAFGGLLTGEVGVREVDRDIALICNRLGGLCREWGEIARAAAYYQRSLEIYRRLARDMGTARARRDMSVSLERLGDIRRKQKNRSEAQTLYSQALDIRAALAESQGTASARRDLSAILTKLGNICREQGDIDGADESYAEALKIDQVLAEEQKTPQAWDDYAVSLVKMADVDRARMRFGDAVERTEKAVKILERNVAQTGSVLYRKHLASSLEKLAKAWAQSDQPAQAEACYRRAVRLREELADEYPSHTSRHELATTCFLFADHARDAGMMERALRLWEEMCHDHPEYAKYAERVRGALEGLT